MTLIRFPNIRVMIGALFLCAGAHPQSGAAVVATGNLSVQRMSHTATLLEDGSVLVAGGGALLPGWPVWASAEVYDPAAGLFRAVGNMTIPRTHHTATKLPDGKVLITGGIPSVDFSTPPNQPVLATAEVYDPSTQTFTRTGDLHFARWRHAAVLLPSGKVLLLGGTRGQDTPAELYDPSTGTFTETGSPMVKSITPAVTVLLQNGHVLVASAVDANNAGAEVYDPETGIFSRTGAMVYPHFWPSSATVLPDGRLLLTKSILDWFSTATELYDPTTGQFTAGPDMERLRSLITATPLANGDVLIAGRDYSWPYFGGSAEVYSHRSGTFGQVTPIRAEEGLAATRLLDGTVLLSGGWKCCGYSIEAAEIYQPAASESRSH
jgi:hypothetical protein